MADQSDVETALVAAAMAALYPQGLSGPSVCGAPVRLYRGWPESSALDADLAAGYVNITVFPEETGERNTTRYLPQWSNPAPVTPTLLVTTTQDSVTFAGSAGAGQIAGILADADTYVYPCQTGDAPANVAANLASQIMANRPVALANATITLPGVGRLIARTAATQGVFTQIRRQEQIFRLIGWCADPAIRDAAMIAVDQALAGLYFLPLADGRVGRSRFRQSITLDRQENASLYRRDLLYSVEYPTLQTATLAAMLFGTTTIGTAANASVSLTS
jgi:glycosyltransferase involved in cell wall biosynthesis